jgi:hypothetical protein
MGDNAVWKTVKPFVNGGMSGMAATVCIQPIDMVKVRLQTGETGGPVGVAMRMIKQEGPGALYKGLSAGLLRQATYTTARLGIYKCVAHRQPTPDPRGGRSSKPSPRGRTASCHADGMGLHSAALIDSAATNRSIAACHAVA